MRETSIDLHGPTASLDHRAGDVTAQVMVSGGRRCVLVDRERDRCRVDAMPGPDRDRWTSGSGLLLIARRRWFGARIVFDRLPAPVLIEVDHPTSRRKSRRPHLKRDLVCCLSCGRTVAVERERKGGGFRLITPCRRLAARIRSVLTDAGVSDALARCLAVGDRAGRLHGLDCHPLPFAGARAMPSEDPPKRRGRGRPRLVDELKLGKSPFPWDLARSLGKASPTPCPGSKSTSKGRQG